jgi:hypothetical protein
MLFFWWMARLTARRSASADAVIHARFIHDFANCAAAAEPDRLEVLTVTKEASFQNENPE